MKMPLYVNPEVLLSEDDVHHIIKEHPSSVKKMKLYAHVAVTNAIIKEMSLTAEKERGHIATWLDGQGGVYAKVAKAIREGVTPTLEQPAPSIDQGTSAAKLREALTDAVQQRDALQIEVESLRAGTRTTTHPKPWAVRSSDGKMSYYDTRAGARREANGGIIVDCR